MRHGTIGNSFAVAMAALIFTAAGLASAAEEQDAEAEELETISLDTLPGSEAADDLADLDGIDEMPQPEPTERQTGLDELRSSFELYKAAIAARSYDEADTLAKRMVELSIRLYGLDSHESAKSLTNLGLVQHRNKEYEAAVLNFTASIGIIERIEDRLNSDLINPLRGLAAAQLGSGRPDLARASYDRAVHVSHVNEGPHNLMQIEVLEELAEAYLSMGEREEALDVHQFIYNLEARNTDLDSEDILPALERQARWLRRMRLHEKERMTWRRVISILEKSRGKKDLSLIDPLTGLGQSYLYVSDYELELYAEASMATGDTYLKRALRIAERNPDADWNVMQKTMITLGDFYTLTQRATKASRIYAKAWELLSADEERLAARAALLERPVGLNPVFPPKYYASERDDNGQGPPENFETGTITIGYRVSSRGATRDIRVVDAAPAGLEDLEYSVARELRRLAHRPRMADGVAVETLDQTYQHEFYYRPSDLPRQEETDVDAVAADAQTAEES